MLACMHGVHLYAGFNAGCITEWLLQLRTYELEAVERGHAYV